MSEKQTGGLSMRIGLTLSQLQSDFLAAEQTVKQGIAALNRQQNLVKLRMETDLSGLDAVVDKTKILQVQEQGLTQLLEMQRDKLKLATAAYQDYANSKNANEVVAKKLETSMERERLAVARLEAQLKNLSAQKISFDASKLQENISQITAKIQNVRLKAEFDTSQLKGANSAFDAQKIHVAAVTKELELQRQKLIQLREAMYRSASTTGGDSVQTISLKSNVLQQMQEITRLETKLKELSATNINLQIRADSLRQAENQINENIARINARIENIKVRTELDTSKLSGAASEFDKAKAHVQGLNRELDLQNQKLAEMKRALATSISANGLNHVKTINLDTDIRRQIQEIDKLKAKIQELNNISPPKNNNLLSGYLNIKGDISGRLNQIATSFTGITSAAGSADGAITKALDIIGAIPHPAGKAVAALAAIPLVIKGIENSLLELAKPAISGGDSFYVMSRGMQLSVADMAKLSTIAKVTGIEIGEVNNSLRRFSMQMTKAGERNNLAIQTLKRYGAEITDENGRLKNAVELAGELGKALKAAQAEGNGAAFRDIVGGKFWSGDFITFLEDFADNMETASKIVKNGLANPTWAHQIRGEINTMNTQAAQLHGAFSASLMPVADEIVPRTTERLGELTKAIAANKENIKFLGDTMALPIRLMNEFTDSVISLSNAIDEAKNKETTLGKVFESYGKYRDDLAALMNVAPMTALWALTSPIDNSTDAAIAAYRSEIEEFKRTREEAEQAARTKNDAQQARAANTEALNRQNLEQQQKLEAALAETENRRIKNVQEAEDIIYRLRHSNFENSLRDLEKWEAEQIKVIEELKELSKNFLGEDNRFDDEENAIYELSNAKRLQLEEEKEAKLAEIRQRISAAERTEFENRMIAIEDEKDAWIAAGMEKAEAEQLAEKQKADYILNVEQELSAAIQELHQSDFEKRLAQIEKEKQAWIKKGASITQAEQLAQAKIQQLNQQTEEKLNDIRGSVAALFRSDIENRIAQVEKEQQAWIKAGMDEAEAEELAAIKKSKIVEDYASKEQEKIEQSLEARAKAEEDYHKKVQAAQEEANRKNASLRNEALNVLKQEAKEFEVFLKEGYSGLQKLLYDKLLKSGVNPESLKKMTPDKLEQYKSAKEQATKSFLPNWRDPYSPAAVELPKSLQEIQKPAEVAAQSLSIIPEAAQNAAQSLNNFANNVFSGEFARNRIDSGNNIPATYDATNFPVVIQSATDSLNQLPIAISGVFERLAEFSAPQISEINNPFAAMEPQVESFVQQFSGLSAGMQEVTVKLNDFANFISELASVKNNQPATTERKTVEVNTSVQIEEAHAWDYSHIQELAEKVADILEPRLIRAVGGDSNSYG